MFKSSERLASARVLAIRNHIKEHQRRNPISVLVLSAVAFCC